MGRNVGEKEVGLKVFGVNGGWSRSVRIGSLNDKS